MKYLIIDEVDAITYKTDTLTQMFWDEFFDGGYTVIDVLSEKECYRLDNDHQPVWEDIGEEGCYCV